MTDTERLDACINVLADWYQHTTRMYHNAIQAKPYDEAEMLDRLSAVGVLGACIDDIIDALSR